MNRKQHFIAALLITCVIFILGGCTATAPSASIIIESEPSLIDDYAMRQEELRNELFRRDRFIADTLYAAKNAYDDDNLMTPVGGNAYERYNEILGVDPGNAIALDGLQEILQRYIELADSSIGVGRYENSQLMLDRAAIIDKANPQIASARLRLEGARLVQVNFFPFDGEDLTQQNLEILVQLASIGKYIKGQSATFLITARNDAEGRWIYKVMRTAAGGARLRGDITLGTAPGVQVNIPQQKRS